jgi:hypothetical protein
MVRCVGLVGLMVVMMAAAGCGGSVKEIAPVKEEAKSLVDPKAKALQGMPEEMRKKMEAKK